MGRIHLLSAGATLLLGSALLTACAPTAKIVRNPNDPHREIACSTCHSGPLAEGGLAAVPAATCTTAACHAAGGPNRVDFRSVAFEHRDHSADSVVALGCAGCHAHADGADPLSADVDACSLCHLSDQERGSRGECRLCHQDLSHAGRVSPSLSVPHEGLPWIEGGCVRCHYDVTRPAVAVRIERCGACHADLDAAVTAGIGEDLHGSHTGSTCTACHREGTHRIRAMTSALSLACVDCHAQGHDLGLASQWPQDFEVCSNCHTSVHQAQQRLMLGLLEGVARAAPSEKFQAGLTCRSCHRRASGADGAGPVRGASAACVACHRPEFATVLEWWKEGSADRIASAKAYVETAAARLEDREGALPPKLADALSMVTLVENAGAVHNPTLAHRLLVEADDRTTEAYREAGLITRPPPDLGREPRMGLCSYCHYRRDDPWQYQEMSSAFHRDVLRIR